MKDTIIHIGYGKTATTTLQKNLFANHSELLYLGRPYTDENVEKAMVSLDLGMIFYDPSVLKKIAEEYRKKADSENKILMLSEETVTYWDSDRGRKIERLYAAFTPCKFIVTIRNQKSMLESYYSNYGFRIKDIYGKPTSKCISFDEWLNMHYEESFNYGYAGGLRYSYIIDFLVKKYGRENVGIFLFEQFMESPEDYIGSLCDFIGIKKDEAIELIKGKHDKKTKLGKREYLRFVSKHVFTGWIAARIPLFQRILKGIIIKYGNNEREKIPESWNDRLRNLYTPGNRILRDKYGLPLEKYGYYL